MSNHDPYSDSPSLLVGFGTTKVYSADRSRHCHGINQLVQHERDQPCEQPDPCRKKGHQHHAELRRLGEPYVSDLSSGCRNRGWR
jgi:hypothetical protein